jgi:hypothetical protein
MRGIVAAVAAAALVGMAGISGMSGLAAIAQDSRSSDSLERAFVANGRITMDLSAGEYRIAGSADNRIRLRWSVRDADQLAKVEARADIRNQDAKITIDGPSNHFKVLIDVPSRADLRVRLTAGELRIDGIEGNKDVESHAGDLRIDVGRPEDYHHVDASVWAGEIHALPYHVTKEGLFRSFDWNGKGPYRLHAKLKAGEVRLTSKTAADR